MGKIIALAAAKGGVGKTVLTAALGERLAARDQQICLLDACAGLRGLDLPLDLQDRIVFDWLDLAHEDCTMEQALVRMERESTSYLLAAPQGILPEEADAALIERLLHRLQKRFDRVLIDVPSGIGLLSRQLCAMSDECLLITTTDDAAQRATERMSSLLHEQAPDLMLALLVNRISASAKKADQIALPIAAYLDLPLYAAVCSEQSIQTRSDRAACLLNPRKYAWIHAIEQAADHLCGNDNASIQSNRERRKPWLSLKRG